jgi:hypothetical protein
MIGRLCSFIGGGGKSSLTNPADVGPAGLHSMSIRSDSELIDMTPTAPIGAILFSLILTEFEVT